jgi:hypothetical protein
MAQFCLSSLLDPGYTPGGTWTQVSQPTGGVTFTIDSTDQGCLDSVDYTGDTFTYATLSSCLTPGIYTFEYIVENGDCTAPVEASIEIYDTSTEIGPAEDIYLCRNGEETSDDTYSWMYSDGSLVDNQGFGNPFIDLDTIIGGCDGNTIPIAPGGAIGISYPIAGSVIVYTSSSFRVFFLYFSELAQSGKLTTNGISDDKQTCGELTIARWVINNDPGCGVEITQKLIISPIIGDYSETVEACETSLNLYDNMPSGLLSMISAACNGTNTQNGGTTAIYEMVTDSFYCNLPGSTLQIFYRGLTATTGFLPLLTTTTWDATSGEEVLFQVEWTPTGTNGFTCGQPTILTFDNEDCCDPSINFQISGAGIPETLTCTNLNIGITSLSDGSCECADTTVDIDLDYTVYVNNVSYITGNIDQTFTVNGNTTVNNFDIPIDFCDFITGDEIGIGWQVNTIESASGCTITGQTNSNGEQYITTVTETQSADCGCCIDDPIENCQMFFIEESAGNWGITIAGTDEIYYTPTSSITDQANQDALLEYLLDAGCSSTISIELIGSSWLKIYNFNGLIDRIYSDAGTFPREADCCEQPNIVISNLADLCDEPICFGNRGEDYRFKDDANCTPDVDHVVITSDIPVTWTVTDTVGSTGILSEDEYEIDIQIGNTGTVMGCNSANISLRDFTVTANTCESTTDEIQIVWTQYD